MLSAKDESASEIIPEEFHIPSEMSEDPQAPTTDTPPSVIPEDYADHEVTELDELGANNTPADETSAEVPEIIYSVDPTCSFWTEEQFTAVSLPVPSDGMTGGEGDPTNPGWGTSTQDCVTTPDQPADVVPQQPTSGTIAAPPTTLANTGGTDLAAGILLGAVLFTLGVKLLFKRITITR